MLLQYFEIHLFFSLKIMTNKILNFPFLVQNKQKMLKSCQKRKKVFRCQRLFLYSFFSFILQHRNAHRHKYLMLLIMGYGEFLILLIFAQQHNILKLNKKVKVIKPIKLKVYNMKGLTGNIIQPCNHHKCYPRKREEYKNNLFKITP